MARFEVTAPDGSRHEITAPDDASPDQVMEYAKQQFSKMPAAKPRTFAIEKPKSLAEQYPGLDDSGDEWARRVADNPLTRKVNVFQDALIPGANRLGSVLEAGIRQLGGSNRTLAEDLKREYAKRNRASDLIEKDFGVTDAPFRSLGWLAGGAALKLPEAAIASANYVPQAQQFLNNVVQSVRPNAAFGAMQGGLDSRKEDVPGVLGDTGLGMIGGALLGPAVPLTLNAAGRVGNKLGDAYRYMTGRGTQARENVLNRVDEWKEAGVKPFAPALTDNPVMRATGEGGVGSIFGGRLRQAAQQSIDDTTTLARRLMQSGTNGAPSSDTGQRLQDDLRDALLGRSKSKGEIGKLSDDELQRITGPAGDTGFMPPRPRVDPMEPREMPPFRVDPIDPESIRVDPVRPRDVQPPKQNNVYTQFDDIPVPDQYRQPMAAAERQIADLERAMAGLKTEFDDYAQRFNIPPEQFFKDAKNAIHPANPVYQKLVGTFEELQQSRSRLDQLRKAADDERDAMWTEALLREDTQYRRQFDQDRQRYETDVREAQREAAEETARRRAEAMQKAQYEAEAEARGKYAAQQEKLRAEAEEATRRAQASADGQWERDIINSPGLNPGVSRESYPTVYDAAYELATRRTPVIQRNPLGGPGKSGSPYKTALENVLDEFGLEGRRQGLVPGYKPGGLFQETGDWAPHVGPYIDELVGPDIARRLNAYGDLRKTRGFAPAIQGIRDLRTAVREAAQAAEKPPFPGVPRKREAAALRRIEAAITEDMYRFMEEAGPKGQAASHLWRSTDRSYGEYIQDLRKPLSKLYGDNVQPVEAMDRIAQAFVDGDLKTVRSFMRVMHEKGDPKYATTAVLAHLTNNARSLREFVEGLGKIPPESRRELFRGQDGSTMLREIKRLEDIAARLLPYEKSIERGTRFMGRGPDLTNPANIALGATMLANWWLTAVTAMGAAGVARFMASPRYLSWLTRGAAIKDRTQWNKHVQVLMRFADSDKENLGAGIVESIQAMQPETPQPQPQRKPPLPGMMRLGGPKPADLPSGRTPITFSRRAVTPEDKEAAEKFREENKNTPIIREDAQGNKLNVPWYEALFQDTGVLPEQGTVKRKPRWMKEIDDSTAVLNDDAIPNDRFIPLLDVFKHDKLQELYPELSNIKIRINPKHMPDAEAFWDSDSRELVIDPKAWKERDKAGRRDLFFHELQHAIDSTDGLPYTRLSESLADTTGFRQGMDEATRRAKPPSFIYDFKPDQYIYKDEHPDLAEGWRTHAVPLEERAITKQRGKRPPPGMMKLGGPRDQLPGSFAESPFNEMFAAAAEKGVDYRKASPQEVIDAAWAANPTDGMAEAIERAARRLNLNLPWQKR